MFWSPSESQIYQNARLLNSPDPVAQGSSADARGRRQPGARHRVKEQEEDAFVPHSGHCAHEPPVPRRQWSSEDPSTHNDIVGLKYGLKQVVCLTCIEEIDSYHSRQRKVLVYRFASTYLSGITGELPVNHEGRN